MVDGARIPRLPPSGAPVVQCIYVDRVRVGPGTYGPAGAAQAEGAVSSDSTDSSSRLVRDDVERDTRALTVAVEKDLATGRPCQAFVREMDWTRGLGDLS